MRTPIIALALVGLAPAVFAQPPGPDTTAIEQQRLGAMPGTWLRCDYTETRGTATDPPQPSDKQDAPIPNHTVFKVVPTEGILLLFIEEDGRLVPQQDVTVDDDAVSQHVIIDEPQNGRRFMMMVRIDRRTLDFLKTDTLVTATRLPNGKPAQARVASFGTGACKIIPPIPTKPLEPRKF